MPLQRKHWIAVRQVGHSFYNLDSKLDAPEMIGSESELLTFLEDQVGCKEKELLLVMNPIVAQSGAWISDEESEGKQAAVNGIACNDISQSTTMDSVHKFIDSDGDSVQSQESKERTTVQ